MASPPVDSPVSHPAATGAKPADPSPREPDAAGFFANVLDVINPLQHIPIISTVYRAITGDEISGPAKLVGGGLFGGIFGAAAAAVSVVVEEATGRDVGEHALAMFTSDDAGPNDTRPNADQLAAVPAAIPADPGSDPRHIVWNGIRATPTIPDPAQQARSGAAGDPPALAPQPVNPPLLAQSRLEQESAADLAARITWNGPRADGPGTTDAANGAADARPAPPPADWVGQALAEAQTVAAAPDQPATPKPWIAGAMLEALEKYEVLAKSRGGGV